MHTRTYLISSSKGGAAKSSLSLVGAVLLPKNKDLHGNTIPNGLVDIDPQGTSLNVCKKRIESGVAAPSVAAANIGGIHKSVEKFINDGVGNIVIDSPPNVENRRIRQEALQNPHLNMVVIPTKMGDDDTDAAIQTAVEAVEAGKDFVFVMTMVKKSNFLEYAKDKLENAAEKLGGALCPAMTFDRIAWMEARFFNQIVNEYEAKGLAAKEAKSVWVWIHNYTKKVIQKRAESIKEFKVDME